MPVGEEAGVGLRRDRLDLGAQPGQGAALQRAQHLGVAQLLAAAAGEELALDHAASLGEARERGQHRRRAEAEAPGHVVGAEGPCVRA